MLPFSQVPAFLEVHDIAGLVKGANEGQGLGNAFLSHIRAVDGIFHVLRILTPPTTMMAGCRRKPSDCRSVSPDHLQRLFLLLILVGCMLALIPGWSLPHVGCCFALTLLAQVHLMTRR
jgi:hypothetical protein